MRKRSRLILALDVPDRKSAIELTQQLAETVDAIKVGYPLILSAGLEIVSEVAQYSDVICDLKVADTPHTGGLITELAVEAGASGVIAHAFVGRDSVQACVQAARGKDVFLVVEMSHPGSKEYIQPVAEQLARLAVDTNVAGVIAPGTRPQSIKRIREIVGDLLILAPGIGVQGGSAVEAIEAGADYIIVGRSIYTARDPRTEAQRITGEISRAARAKN